jgi:mono/diheme cytochrome c family protein
MTDRKLHLAIVICFATAGIFWGTRDVRVASAQASVDFVRDIQPIFAANCARCHGAEKQMGQLRLDDKKVAARVIIPGKSKDSRLLHRILGLNNEAQMPKGGEPLKAEQIDLIRRWIDQGADWPEGKAVEAKKHWAYIAPVRPALPTTQNKTWSRNPIDRFILARLEKDSLTPSAEADKVTLLRRLSLDLTGLPPTPEEVDAYLRDVSPRAYEKQVDRLLASPHYGERWGRHWLDAARYSDSDGYEKDKQRFVWFYRDWVINSLNKDKPYDQFIIEQIAGDMLPNPTQEQIVATGFLRNSMINEEGGIDPEQFRMEAMFDRMDAIGKAVLGVTIQCAQCHNHKFDPLKQEEYYKLFAFLNNSNESNVIVYTPEEQMKRANLMSETREIEAKLREIKPDWMQLMNAWEDRVRNDQPEWKIIQPAAEDISTGGQRYLPQPDGSILALGYAPTKHRVKLEIKTDVQNITGFRLELLNDPNLPMNGPGRSMWGTCALTEFEAFAAPAKDEKKSEKVKIARGTADVNPPETELAPIFEDKSRRRRVEGPIEYALDGKDDTAWGINAGPGQRNIPRKAVFAAEKPISNEGGTALTIYLKQLHGGWNSDDNQSNNIGRFRLSITTAPNPVADPLPTNVREILSVPRDRRTKAQVETLFGYWRTTVPEFESYNKQIAEIWKKHPEGSSQLVLNERGQLRDTHMLKRGDWLKPDKTVEPGVPAFLNPLPAGVRPDRLAFGKWLVSRDSPTTARSIVNRIWQSYFGTGIVSTSEDLGKQAETPSHPELLDWLAVELMEPSAGETERRRDGGTERRRDGVTNQSAFRIPHSASRIPHSEGSQAKPWSLKHIHRLIVTSAAYRQTSNVTPKMMEKDPYNRLIARGPRYRVEGEIVRDIALSASGLLSPKVGGASVFPPAPEFLFQPPVSYGPKPWLESTGEDRYRRALYTFRYRSVPYPMLQAFDAPPGDQACVRRARSNTPLQALTALNETLFMEASRALALKTVKEGGVTDAARLNFAFRRVLARKPTVQESSELLHLLNKQQERFVAGQANPWNLAADDPEKSYPLPKGATMEQLAAWTAVSRVLLNLDETITKE